MKQLITDLKPKIFLLLVLLLVLSGCANSSPANTSQAFSPSPTATAAVTPSSTPTSIPTITTNPTSSPTVQPIATQAP